MLSDADFGGFLSRHKSKRGKDELANAGLLNLFLVFFTKTPNASLYAHISIYSASKGSRDNVTLMFCIPGFLSLIIL